MTGLVARLIAAGTSPELVEEVAMLIAEKRLAEAAISTRRENDRNRQERKRHAISRDVTLDTVTDRDVTDSPPLSRPPNENISNPPTHTPPDNTPRARKADHFLPESWKPTEFGLGTESRAVVDGWPPGEAKRQLEHFAAHHGAKGNKFSNWQKAWSTWVLNKRDFGNGRSNQDIRNGGGNGARDNRDGIAKALDRRLAELDQSAGQAGRPDLAPTANLRIVTDARALPG